MSVDCPDCGKIIEIDPEEHRTDVKCEFCGSHFSRISGRGIVYEYTCHVCGNVVIRKAARYPICGDLMIASVSNAAEKSLEPTTATSCPSRGIPRESDIVICIHCGLGS